MSQTEKPLETAYLGVQANQENILLPIQAIESVILIAKLQQVPKKDLAFEGMLNYHGTSIPIYCLSKLINQNSEPNYTLDTPIVLCQVDNEKIGLIIEKAEDIVLTSKEHIQKPKFSDSAPYVDGIIEKNKQSFWILNLKKLIEERNMKLDRGIAEHE